MREVNWLYRRLTCPKCGGRQKWILKECDLCRGNGIVSGDIADKYRSEKLRKLLRMVKDE